jgi:hypothetical protein
MNQVVMSMVIATVILSLGIATTASQTFADRDPNKPVKAYCYLSDQNIKCFTSKSACNSDREAQTQTGQITKCRPY